MRRIGFFVILAVVTLLSGPPAFAQEEKPPLRVLLLGDSTTIGSVCRQTDPEGPHLEQIIQLLLAAEPDLPPVEVINQGRDGEFIHGLLTSGRYDREITPLGPFDFVIIRFGLNDIVRRDDFEANFPSDYAELIDRVRRDFPTATIIPATTIPYMTAERDTLVNTLIHQVAETRELPLLDIFTRYSAELEHGPDMLNYRRYPLDQIPEKHRGWVQPFVRSGQVVVMDNRLDAHFRDLPGWSSDRHPNLAGYHVIADETASFLARLIREPRKSGAEAGTDPDSQPRPTPAAPPLDFIDTGFENASPLWYETQPDGTTFVHLLYDHERASPNRAAGHFHFRVHAAPGSTHVLEFRNLDNVWNGRRASVASELKAAVISPDGQVWQPVALEPLPDNRVRLTLTMPGPELYVARVEPYRLSDLDAWLESIRDNPLVEITTIGHTPEGRSLEIVRVGRPEAPHRVFLRARAHPWEPGGNWVVQGLASRLLENDEAARSYLDRYCVYILPMANKDGVARGLTRFNLRGMDLNRHWDRPADASLAPENHALEAWLEAMIQQGFQPHLAIELHNDGYGQLHVSQPSGDHPDPGYPERMATLHQLLRQHTAFPEGQSSGAFGQASTLAEGWLARYQIDAAVLELNVNWITALNDYPSAAHWQHFGRQLAQVVSEYFATVSN